MKLRSTQSRSLCRPTSLSKVCPELLSRWIEESGTKTQTVSLPFQGLRLPNAVNVSDEACKHMRSLTPPFLLHFFKAFLFVSRYETSSTMFSFPCSAQREYDVLVYIGAIVNGDEPCKLSAEQYKKTSLLDNVSGHTLFTIH